MRAIILMAIVAIAVPASAQDDQTEPEDGGQAWIDCPPDQFCIASCEGEACYEACPPGPNGEVCEVQTPGGIADSGPAESDAVGAAPFMPIGAIAAAALTLLAFVRSRF